MYVLGEKGIGKPKLNALLEYQTQIYTGFKAVFKITDVVYVLSRKYSFYFDRTQELGMITPIWSTEYPVRRGWTTFRLKMSSNDNLQRMVSYLEDVKPSLLLFLRKLRGIDLSIGHKRVVFHRSEIGTDIVLSSFDGSATQSHRYLIVKHQVPVPEEERKRPGIKETELVLAFPMDMGGEPVIENQDVYAFLPLRTYGFKVNEMVNIVGRLH